MARVTKAVVNKWWVDAPFGVMEKITGYRKDDFSSEDGYQEFVDACDAWWDKLPFSKKKEYYIGWN
jgi:hypothetical protein